jgi:hypothetical protein
MKRFFCCLLLFFAASNSNVFAQPDRGAPDMKAIRMAVTDSASPFFYPHLLARYRSGDSLSLQAKRMLYFGFSAQPGYSPYGSGDFADSVRSIVKRETILEPDYIRLLAFSDSVLATDPLNLGTLNYYAHAAKQLNRPLLTVTAVKKMHAIVDAIESTGDGRSIQSAFWVTNVSDEYFLIGALGYEFGGEQRLVDGPCDYLTLSENKDSLKGLYFNVGISMGALDKLFSDSERPHKRRRKR